MVKALQSATRSELDPRVYANFRSLVTLRHQARGFHFLPRQPLGSILAGRHQSRLRGRGLNFEELRHYHTGDDIRQMDWRVTRRTGKPHVRAYSEERERSALICVDQRQAMFFGSEHEMKSVTAAQLAALAAWRILDDNDRVGGLVFNDNHIKLHRPQRHSAQVLRLLREIESQNHALCGDNPEPDSNGSQQLNRVLEEIARMETHDTLVVLITDWSGWDNDTFRWIKRITRHNDLVSAWVVDPMEQDLSRMKGFIASDGNKQLSIDDDDQGLYRAFSQDFNDKLARLQGELIKYRLPVLKVDTRGEVLRQLIRSLTRGSAEDKR